ncbi:Qat anti-phage system TatD family nuclease QatD [Sulfuricurvum sp.]|uniref:Qat anti-phage system TatD family nuclease QatD n=1 Tax=Sulfuricurvum sp. TaxID=2025608 RepID=UPI00261624AF|nr:Qat anti-phage system TatD family nuclease QatD [Sulfuricurvum sp.]MDD3595582.1 TatD family hydrolase [Sulfuricurvum sp.]
MKTQYVDYHCHLDLYPNHLELLAESQKNGIATLAVTTTPKAWKKNVDMASEYDQIRVALGLHPQLISERANELSLFEKLLDSTRFVGEIGLDAGKKFYHSFEQQQQVFQAILRMCSQYENKIISIHSAYSSTKVLDALEKNFFPNNGKVVLHWFTGSKKDFQRAIEMGCNFSINQEMLKNEKILSNIINIPITRILTETDGPFVKHNSTSIKPLNIKEFITHLANLLTYDKEELRLQILQNLGKLEE